MSKITVWFIRSAMIYLLIAVFIGVWMGLSPVRYYIPAHAHLTLLGWMSMFVYGVAYHILPRFSGRPLYSDRLADIHFWTANIGLVGMAFSWFIFNQQLLVLFSIIEAFSIVLFVYNMFRTVQPASAIKKP